MAMAFALIALVLFLAGGAVGSVVMVFGAVIAAMVALVSVLTTGSLTRFPR